MAFLTGHPTIDETSGAVVGGVNTTLSLRHPDRSVADLHNLFQGNLSVFVSFHDISFAEDPTAEELRETLIADQVLKDDELRYFEAHRKFPNMGKGEMWA